MPYAIPMVEEEPQIDSEDTAKSLPVMVTVPTTDTVILAAPIPHERTTEPVLLVVEKESWVENEDTAT